jgi:hypothetical protein
MAEKRKLKEKIGVFPLVTMPSKTFKVKKRI